MNVNPFVIDCDTGRDDALAIWISLNLDLPLKAVISSYGNTTLENVIENNRRVLHFARASAEIALYAGCEAPGCAHAAYHNIVKPRQEKAGNGLCNVELPESPPNFKPQDFASFKNLLNGFTAETPLDYVITGPATNFALLLKETEPALREKIGTVTMMGGKFEDIWDRVPGADFNLACDPAAINDILNAGVDFRFVPMDATWPIALTLEEVEALEPQSATAEMAKALMIAHCKFFSPEPVFRFHDPAVIMALLLPELFEVRKLIVVTDEANPDFGRLVADESGYPVCVFRPDDNARAEILRNMLETLGFSLRATKAAQRAG